MSLSVAILTTDKREHERTYSGEPSFGAAPEALLLGLKSFPDVQVHVFSCLQKQVESPEKLASNIWYHGLHVPKIGWLRTGYQGCIRAVRRRLREIQPDIVHGQGTERDCALSAVFSGYPNVLTIHGNMVAMAAFYKARFGSFHWMAARLEGVALARTLGVFCNSAYTENMVRGRTRRTWRVPNPLRMDFFSELPTNPASKGPVLLNVGVVSPYKRQLEILAVVRRIRERGFPIQIRFAGSVDPKAAYGAEFLRRLREAEAMGFASYLGLLSTGQLVRAFDEASGLIHFPREEAFGLVVAEALARNLKLFSARVGGIPDIAEGVDAAELFSEDDWQGLEQSIVRWLGQGCPKAAAAGREMKTRYHPDVIARRHIEIYREVLRRDS